MVVSDNGEVNVPKEVLNMNREYSQEPHRVGRAVTVILGLQMWNVKLIKVK